MQHGIQSVKSIMVFAGSSGGHYANYRDRAWFIDTPTGQGNKSFSSLINALSELERVTKVPADMFTVGYPDMAIVPILRRVG